MTPFKPTGSKLGMMGFASHDNKDEDPVVTRARECFETECIRLSKTMTKSSAQLKVEEK